MKKLMIAMAVTVMAAYAANAAKVKWGFDCTAEGDTDYAAAADVSGMNAYLIYAPDWDASNVGASLAKAIACVDVGTSCDFYAEDGIMVYSYNAYGANATQYGDTSLSDDVAGSSKDFYVVFADDSQYAAYSDAAYVSPDADNDQNRDGAFVPVAFVAAADLQSYGGSTPSDVPEPTSGLLMLVGLAGLALRRRRA